MRKQRIDLIGANEPAPHALLRRQRGDVGAVEQDTAGVRPQHSGHQVDQRGLAGAVGADQRIAHAGREIKLDVGGDNEGAEALVESVGGQRDVAHGFSFTRRVNSDRPPRIPFGNNRTTAIRMSPIQKYQYCGLRPEN